MSSILKTLGAAFAGLIIGGITIQLNNIVGALPVEKIIREEVNDIVQKCSEECRNAQYPRGCLEECIDRESRQRAPKLAPVVRKSLLATAGASAVETVGFTAYAAKHRTFLGRTLLVAGAIDALDLASSIVVAMSKEMCREYARLLLKTEAKARLKLI